MIAMGVCEDDGIKVGDIFPQHLLTKVRAGIDDKTLAIDLKVYGGTEALVAIIE